MLSLQISLKIEISLFCRLFQLRDKEKNKERHQPFCLLFVSSSLISYQGLLL